MPIDASVRWRWIQAGVVIAVVLVAIALIVPAVEQAREGARRSQSKNNLRFLGLALENYHDVYKMLPYGGIFDDHGTPFHGWTTALDPLLSPRAWYSLPDPDFPWDDPVNIDHILHGFATPFQNPGVAELRSPDDLPLAHYAANQTLFHRNNVVSLDKLSNKNATALLGECAGSFPPVGYPFNWRDVSLGLGRSPDGFGCPVRNITMMLMGDQSVRALDNRTDAAVLQTFAGPAAMTPSSEQVAKPSEPYRLRIRKYWRYLNVVRAHKTLMTFRLAPEQTFLHVDFRHYDDPNDAVPEKWRSYFQEFIQSAAVAQVELEGRLRADELRPFLEIPTLQRLTITGADIADDKDAVLASARKDIVVD